MDQRDPLEYTDGMGTSVAMLPATLALNEVLEYEFAIDPLGWFALVGDNLPRERFIDAIGGFIDLDTDTFYFAGAADDLTDLPNAYHLRGLDITVSEKSFLFKTSLESYTEITETASLITSFIPSAAQIRDKFALPDLPTHISDVYVPAGTRIRVGKVAPQKGWGTGGAYQYELLQRLQEGAFRNTRPLR